MLGTTNCTTAALRAVPTLTLCFPLSSQSCTAPAALEGSYDAWMYGITTYIICIYYLYPYNPQKEMS